jgi:methyl halide transferase
MNLSEDYWNNCYMTHNTGWDIGHISTPLKAYFDQLTNKDLKILIPGCGNAYEAEYLYNKGFKNVYVVDLSETALHNFKNRVPDFTQPQLLHLDFFDLDMRFDLIIEQTFFCAIEPSLRARYAQKMSRLLTDSGKLVGLLFNDALNLQQPPFGGNKKEYLTYFIPYFNIAIFESCYNSIESRKNRELFIKFTLK